MSPPWLWCCLDSRSKGPDGKASKELDERFGDASISGPVSGGWNQNSPTTRTSPGQVSSPSRTSNSSTASKSNKWRRGVFRTQSASNSSPCRSSFDPQDSPPFPAKQIEDAASTTTTTTTQEKPPFVYKPASEDFFKNMSEIGKPRHSCQPSQPAAVAQPQPQPQPQQQQQQQQQQMCSREASVRSANSMRPSSPGDIPCHPSYQNRPLLVAVEESGSTTPPLKQLPAHPPTSANVLDSMLDQRSLAGGTDVSSRSSIDDSGRDSDVEKRQFRSPTPQIPYTAGVTTQLKKHKSKKNRVVTQELVPSTNELFG